MASRLERLYLKAPNFIKMLLLNVRAYLNVRKRYTAKYYTYLETYINLWTAEKSAIAQYQNDKLVAFLLECNNYVPYYIETFKRAGVSNQEIRNNPFDVLKRLPLLSNSDRKTKVSSLINTNPERETVEVGYTSGTSGSPTKNFLDRESIERGFALWSRFHHTIGIKSSDRSVRFSGRLVVSPTASKPPFWIYNKVEDQLFMSSYHLSEKNIPHYIDKLNKFKPKFLDGYPSALYVIAKTSNALNIPIKYKPKAIATTAETLYDYQRAEIEKAFGCPVFNQYASSEGSPFITECISGNLHVNEDSGVFEFLNKNNSPAAPGEIARMVVTSFRNYKTPLIRYDIEDAVLLPEEDVHCDCGCQMPVIEKIIGREDDVLWTPEKGYIGRMDTAFKGLVGIVKSQIIQQTPTSFIVNTIIDSSFTKQVEADFLKNLKDRLGYSSDIEIRIVNEIPLGANGKFVAVKRLFKIE
jgi:phenylacetate-CoA ligase